MELLMGHCTKHIAKSKANLESIVNDCNSIKKLMDYSNKSKLTTSECCTVNKIFSHFFNSRTKSTNFFIKSRGKFFSHFR